MCNAHCYSKTTFNEASGRTLNGLSNPSLNSVPILLPCRGVCLALLICFLEFWSGVIVFALFFLNVLSALW